MTLIEKAQAFAHDAHDSILQKRKYDNSPYWTHTDAVAALVEQTLRDANHGELNDANTVIVEAAHLHDVLEDVAPLNPSYDGNNIVREFGEPVYSLVRELTDVYTSARYPQYNRTKRKEYENARIAKISNGAKTIKLADLINNTSSIVENDPDFAKVYLREKFALLPCLAGGDSGLLARASQQCLDGFAKLGIAVPTIVATSPTVEATPSVVSSENF